MHYCGHQCFSHSTIRDGINSWKTWWLPQTKWILNGLDIKCSAQYLSQGNFCRNRLYHPINIVLNVSCTFTIRWMKSWDFFVVVHCGSDLESLHWNERKNSHIYDHFKIKQIKKEKYTSHKFDEWVWFLQWRVSSGSPIWSRVRSRYVSVKLRIRSHRNRGERGSLGQQLHSNQFK